MSCMWLTIAYNIFSTDSVSIAHDALQCLQGISSSCTGCRHLLRPGYSTLEALTKCYFSQTTGQGLKTFSEILVSI